MYNRLLILVPTLRRGNESKTRKRKATAMAKASQSKWFENCGGWSARHSLDELRAGISKGLLNEQDEYGMTALTLAVASGWLEGVQELLRAGADTELRYHRTGATALDLAVQDQNEAVIAALIKGGANPDAANYWGLTPRYIAKRKGISRVFKGLRKQKPTRPEFRIQNTEHLADHYYPRFKIPERKERETLKPGQAVNLYVYGPTSATKQDAIKVRITARRGRGSKVRYTATVETPIEQTHLPPGIQEVEFGPEHVATVYIPREKKTKKVNR